MRQRWGILVLMLVGVAAIALVAGCSGDSPAGSNDGVSTGALLLTDGFQFDAIVAAIDYGAMTLTCVDPAYTVTATDETVVVSKECGVETPITFDDIQAGDSVRVCGMLCGDNTVTATKIQVLIEIECQECPEWDIEFRGTINTLDYAGETFTVAERTETITTDDNTVIWGRIVGPIVTGDDKESITSYAASVGEGDGKESKDIIFAFTDLVEGDVVEVKANIVDSETLLAVSIKVANINDRKCEVFDATLATIDVGERMVTFTGMDWTGYVCPGAVLMDAAGNPLTLADFSAGDNVTVKGFPLDETTLQIAQMELK